MKRWMMVVLTVGVVCVAAGVLLAAADDDATAKPGAARGPRLRNVWGRVEDLSTKKKLLGVKIETEEKGETIQIFKLTKDTKVRKEEKVMKLTDLKKGMEVIVFFRPKGTDDKYPTALFIRMCEDREVRPRPRRRP